MDLDSTPHDDTADTVATQTRSSARVRERQQQQQQHQASSNTTEPPSTSSSRRRKRSSAPDPSPGASKGKTKQQQDSDDETQPSRKRARTEDRKGKQRAAATDDDVEDEHPEQSTKQTRYSLRARKPSIMTRKKANSRSKKSKSDPEPGAEPEQQSAPSSSVPQVDHEPEDVEMADEDGNDDVDEHDDEHDDDDDDDGAGDGDGDGAGDAAAAMALFGEFRGLGSYMMSISGRLKTILQNIKPAADATTRLLALQELSEILSISSEDMLAGYFQVDAFVKELVTILSGGGAAATNGGDEDDEDAALAAALLASGGGFQDDTALEAQLLACRCLANLMEALPGSAHTVVYHGAVPVLCSKLVEISYIDLAEQTLSTLEKMSEEYPSAIVREGGLGALLNYLEFFSTTVQRTALQAASNCLRNISTDAFGAVKDVFPIVRRVLGYADARCVEHACLCVIRVVESYHRSAPELLEQLFADSDDGGLARALLGGAAQLSAGTHTLVLRALSTAARASAKIGVALLECDVVDPAYTILTGVTPDLEHNIGETAVMQNIGQRPKDQIEEALGLVCELMPPLPKDGVMDLRAYTEKALAKLIKAKAKADRRSTQSNPTVLTPSASASSSTSETAPPAAVPLPSSAASSTSNLVPEDAAAPVPTPTPAPPPSRAELLRARPLVTQRFMALVVPVLVDVYNASVLFNVRTKALNGLLKALCFLNGDEIVHILRNVPIASWAGSVLSSRDRPSLVVSGLQVVELLLTKAPGAYRPQFRREGVLHEVETLADLEIQTSSGAVERDGLDAATLRARVVRFKFLQGDNEDARDPLLALRALAERLKAPDAGADAVRAVAVHLASHSVSSFEFVQSGLIDGLLAFASAPDRTLDIATRQTMLLDALTGADTDVEMDPKVVAAQPTAFATLVRRLQESLTRMESFEVVTVSQGADDARRNSAQMLARQLRLRLVAEEGGDIPRSCANIVVSIHAIATFQALNDYLRPRVAGAVGPGGATASRFAHMLAALAGGSFAMPGSSRAPHLPPPSQDDGPGGIHGALARRRSSRLKKEEDVPADLPAAVPKEEPQDVQMADADASAPVPVKEETAEPEREPKREPELEPKLEPDVELEHDHELDHELELELEHEHEDEHEHEHSGMLVPDVHADDDLAEDFIDEDFSGDVFQESAVSTQEPEEKTTNVTVAEDGPEGLNVTAQTPQGTRVATPNPAAASRPTPPASTSTPSRPSYAAMLKQRPTDWHLEFSMDDHPLPLDLTVYGAIHQHEMRKAAAAGTAFHPNMIWQGVYTVKFKKVSGAATSQAPTEPADAPVKDRQGTPVLTSMAEDAQHSKILRLLRVLYKLNSTLSDKYAANLDNRHPLQDAAFVNNKLTAKLARQLEEPMIVASSCLPDWALDLSQHFPFLFPFTTRYAFLQSTSFGYARLILKWQAQQARTQEARRDDAFAFLGRLQRQKVRISRKHVLESAVKVFELYGSSSSILEVEYFEEVGTGLGPTLEFYSMVSREFARRDLKIWRDADSTQPGPYVHHPLGLFPAPIHPSQVSSEGGRRRMQIFRVIGQFIGKALLDSRIIDMSFNKIFMKYILDEDVPLTIATLELVDTALAKSLSQVQAFADARRTILSDTSISPQGKQLALNNLRINTVALEDLALDFTVPGYDIELIPNGGDVAVTLDNVDDYLTGALDMLLCKGVAAQAQAFREGFTKVFPVNDLQIFSADELVMIFGNAEEDWGVDTLNEALKADHGFNVDSRAFRDLVNIMSGYDQPTRRDYLQFITGSPKLPIGGFRGLNPPFTVVRKPHEAPLSPDDYLPSVMTCVNYLKLPEYSSKSVMSDKLRVAMKEGVGSFHLS